MTLKRLIVVILVAWLLLGAVALVLFNVGGTTPGDGRGDPIEEPAGP